MEGPRGSGPTRFFGFHYLDLGLNFVNGFHGNSNLDSVSKKIQRKLNINKMHQKVLEIPYFYSFELKPNLGCYKHDTFLVFQIKQTKEDTFLHQGKYMMDLLKKFDMGDGKPISIPMPITSVLGPNEDGKLVDQREYRSMIGSLLYLTASRTDIHFAMFLCARFQASSRTSHRQAVKCIFRYLHSTLEFGLWYTCSISLELRGFLDAGFAGCRIDRKSTFGMCQFLGTLLMSARK